MAAAVVALVNFCVVERSSCAAWDRRSCLKDTLRERETGRLARAEAQTANVEQQKCNEELRKNNEEQKKAHELRMSELRQENERLAELESKLNEIWHS